MTTIEIADRIDAVRRKLAVLALATQGLRRSPQDADSVATMLFELGDELHDLREHIHLEPTQAAA